MQPACDKNSGWALFQERSPDLPAEKRLELRTMLCVRPHSSVAHDEPSRPIAMEEVKGGIRLPWVADLNVVGDCGAPQDPFSEILFVRPNGEDDFVDAISLLS